MTDLANQIRQRQDVAAPGERPVTVAGLVESMRGELARALPAHLTVDRFMRLALTELRQNPRLAECSAPSLLGALMTAAQLGLEPGGPLGQFYLTPRRLKGAWAVVPIVGYQGLRDLAYRSGHVDSIQAEVIRQGDVFRRGADAERGFWFEWHPDEDGGEDRPLVGVLAIARIKGAGVVWRYLDKPTIDERRDRGSAGESGPWSSDYEAMARKTSLRELSKLLPKSTAVAVATTVDEQVQEWQPGAQARGALAIDAPAAPVVDGEPADGEDGS